MDIGNGANSKFRIWLSKSANVLSAALCGVCVAAGLLSIAENCFPPRSGGDVIRILLAAGFALTVVCGIFSRPRLVTKAAFSLLWAITALLCSPPLARAVLFLLGPVLCPLLVFGARWKGARFAVIPFVVFIAFEIEGLRMPSAQDVKIPPAVYLPAALTHERPGNVLLVVGEEDPEGDELLKHITFRTGWLRVNSPQVTLGLGVKRIDSSRFCVAIAGRSARFDDPVSRRGVYQWLIRQLEPDGVLVMPGGETQLLPPGEWHFSSLPGGDGNWVAARRGRAVCVEPEVLDDRIQKFATGNNPPVLSSGAFTAMFPPPPECEVVPPPPSRSPWFMEPWKWVALVAVAAAWVILRLLLCRRVPICTGAAAAETAAAMMLYSMAMVPKWSTHMMDTGISPYALCAGFGLLLLPRPFAIVRNGTRILTEAAVGVLPWLPGFTWCWLPLVSWFCWCLSGSAVFTGLRHENRRSALFGALFGAVCGFLLYLMIGAGASSLSACVAVLLMVPSWLRRR